MSVSKNKGKGLSDEECWQKCCQGDEKAFFYIHERYRIQLFGIAYAMTKKEDVAQDIVQEVFVKIHQKSKENYQVQSIKGLLIDMTKKLSLNAISKAKREKEVFAEYKQGQTNVDVNAGTYNIKKKEFFGRLKKMLSPTQLRILNQKQLGYSQKEMAEKNNSKVTTVKTHLRDAKKNIKDIKKEIF